MAQRVDYAPIPNTTPAGYIVAMNKVYGHAKRNRLKWREMRDWLREQNLWSKDDMPIVLSLMDVRTQPHVALGPFAEKFFAAAKDEDAKSLLFQRLKDANIILTKSVMDVLDTERGGRLFSTHELYRMITSHLYEGDYITLPSFQAWIAWMEASGILRYIGIRWGLSDSGKTVMSYIRNLDMEELLEDDRAEKEGGGSADADEDEAPEAAVPAPDSHAAAAPVAAAAPAASAPTGEPSEEEEELPDDFGGPEAPSEQDAAAFMERLGLTPEDVEGPPPARAAHAEPAAEESAQPSAPPAGRAPASARPAPVVAVQAAPRPAVPRTPVRPAVAVARPAATGLGAPRILASPVDTVARDANAAAIRGWWVGYPAKRLLRADDLGLHPKDYDRDRALFVVKLATLGVVAAEAMDAAPARSWFAALQEVRAFERVWKENDTLETVLADVGFFQANPSHLKLSEVLIHALAFMRRLRLNPGLVERWEKEADGVALARSIHEDLLGGHFPLAALWVLREMATLQLWEGGGGREVAAVPTYRARENAYRLGFVDSLYAEDFAALLVAARSLVVHGAGEVPFDAALENLPEQLGCSFHCGRVHVCTYHCREKIGR